MPRTNVRYVTGQLVSVFHVCPFWKLKLVAPINRDADRTFVDGREQRDHVVTGE